MDWTMAQVIGHNVKVRREAMGMTAAVLGEKIGNVFGKPWPRQTVYMLESGERAMVAQEVVALSQLLDMPLLQLFTPPADVHTVIAGSLCIPADALLAETTADDDMQQLAKALRGLEQTRSKLLAVAEQQKALLDEAKNALLGKPGRELRQGASFVDDLIDYSNQIANRHQ